MAWTLADNKNSQLSKGRNRAGIVSFCICYSLFNRTKPLKRHTLKHVSNSVLYFQMLIKKFCDTHFTQKYQPIQYLAEEMFVFLLPLEELIQFHALQGLASKRLLCMVPSTTLVFVHRVAGLYHTSKSIVICSAKIFKDVTEWALPMVSQG